MYSEGAGDERWHARLLSFLARRPWIMDTVLWVLPLGLWSVLLYTASSSPAIWGADTRAPWLLRFGMELLTVLPLALRRTFPALSAGLIASGAVLQVVTLTGPGMSALTVPAAVYATAKYASHRAGRFFLFLGLFGAFLLGVFLYIVFQQSYGEAPVPWQAYAGQAVMVGFAALVVLSCWLLGSLAGRRRREIAAITERNRLLEREREHEARLAADAERMRIAREMHDVISHSMSVMIAQADGGRYIAGTDADAAGRAFATIGETGRDALAQMRRMLGVLREEGERLEVRPMPDLRDLSQLLADVRAAGLDVTLIGDPGALPQLPEGAGLAIYRIVQEALTNTMKHAGAGARAEVRLVVHQEPEPELCVRISDTGQGSGAADDGAGSGLLGMRERASVHGGTVETQADGSGFCVTARFPLPREPLSGQAAEAVPKEHAAAGEDTVQDETGVRAAQGTERAEEKP